MISNEREHDRLNRENHVQGFDEKEKKFRILKAL